MEKFTTLMATEIYLKNVTSFFKDRYPTNYFVLILFCVYIIKKKSYCSLQLVQKSCKCNSLKLTLHIFENNKF